MSNNISVRRVIVQTINEDGTPDGPASYGVMACDNYEQGYNDMFESLVQLNEAIKEAGGILEVVRESGAFESVSADIGTHNYYGPIN